MLTVTIYFKNFKLCSLLLPICPLLLQWT
uniref:Uncharacterized protein n=1 Tax=Arundo donax TaxID=35708 RepID=A0A0A8Y5F0_ARUDO